MCRIPGFQETNDDYLTAYTLLTFLVHTILLTGRNHPPLSQTLFTPKKLMKP